jgi:hypothetical protein
VTRFVLAGKHVVAVAAGPRRGAAIVTVHGKPVTVEVPAEDRGSSWRDVARQVSAWQAGEMQIHHYYLITLIALTLFDLHSFHQLFQI